MFLYISTGAGSPAMEGPTPASALGPNLEVLLLYSFNTFRLPRFHLAWALIHLESPCLNTFAHEGGVRLCRSFVLRFCWGKLQHLSLSEPLASTSARRLPRLTGGSAYTASTVWSRIGQIRRPSDCAKTLPSSITATLRNGVCKTWGSRSH